MEWKFLPLLINWFLGQTFFWILSPWFVLRGFEPQFLGFERDPHGSTLKQGPCSVKETNTTQPQSQTCLQLITNTCLAGAKLLSIFLDVLITCYVCVYINICIFLSNTNGENPSISKPRCPKHPWFGASCVAILRIRNTQPTRVDGPGNFCLDGLMHESRKMGCLISCKAGHSLHLSGYKPVLGGCFGALPWSQRSTSHNATPSFYSVFVQHCSSQRAAPVKQWLLTNPTYAQHVVQPNCTAWLKTIYIYTTMELYINILSC